MALSLPNVTLCAADCLHPHLAARALATSQAALSFGEVALFADQPVEGPFRSVLIPRLLSRSDYSRFILRDLAQYITTSHVLIIQWDGYVVNPHAWQAEFLNYDYVGAIWPWYEENCNVGNGGFSMRSHRLLALTAEDRFVTDDSRTEDEWICRVYREQLESRCAIRFASSTVANRFSYERSLPDDPTFGFHGLFNIWRYLDDWSLTEMVNAFDTRTIQSREFIELLLQYHSMRKFDLVITMFKRLQASTTPSSLQDMVEKNVASGVLAADMIKQWRAWTLNRSV